MKWKLPKKVKIYEALGCVADSRIELTEKGAKITSSNGDKFYTIIFNEETNSIMSNDNASYWQGYLGYPPIAYLMLIGKISYDKNISDLLKDIKWKQINTKFKNDYDKEFGSSY